MRDFLQGIIALGEIIGLFVLIWIAGKVETDAISIAESIKYVLVTTLAMGIGAVGLWITRDKEEDVIKWN